MGTKEMKQRNRCFVLAAMPMSLKCRLIFQQMYQPHDIIICADGGYQNAVLMKIAPTIVVGDMDSVGDFLPSAEIESMRYPSEKDFTDTQLAIDVGLDKECREFFLFGMTGQRLDHTITNIYMLNFLHCNGAQGKIIDEYGELFLKDSDFTIENKKGDTVSFMAFDGDVENLTLLGMKYPLKQHCLKSSNPIAISNVVLQDKAQVSFSTGKLLVYFPY